MTARVYASTGAFIGRANSYDYRLIAEYAPRIACDGFELMMLSPWYEELPYISRRLSECGVFFPVIHFEKGIGVLLAENTPESVEEAKRLFLLNADTASEVGAGKAVLHLWGGSDSDRSVPESSALLPFFYGECDRRGITLCVENIPCLVSDPLTRWKELEAVYPDISFIFDSRFADFHHQSLDIFKSGLWEKVRHIHISDYLGVSKDNPMLIRPILHPGEGRIDFEELFSEMPPYGEAFTIESPVLSPDGSVDTEKLSGTVKYIADMAEKHGKTV